MADAVHQAGKGEKTSIATVEIQSASDLAHLFHGFATSLFDVAEDTLFTMRSLVIPGGPCTSMQIAGEPLPASWYSHLLPGAIADLQWAFIDPASLLERSWEFSPYPEATIKGEWTQVHPKGAPWVWGWLVTATFAMDPDATLLRTIEQHRKVISDMAVSGRKTLQFQGPPGVLHMAFLSDHMASGH
jgi:hypothetical protein